MADGFAGWIKFPLLAGLCLQACPHLHLFSLCFGLRGIHAASIPSLELAQGEQPVGVGGNCRNILRAAIRRLGSIVHINGQCACFEQQVESRVRHVANLKPVGCCKYRQIQRNMLRLCDVPRNAGKSLLSIHELSLHIAHRSFHVRDSLVCSGHLSLEFREFPGVNGFAARLAFPTELTGCSRVDCRAARCMRDQHRVFDQGMA
mmetsp:Transcript_468/g.1525  ORF Transcript_468/g.1525 Transcript_468/m.1525 type:complete len:204 (+) Transcript_468:571-1182(+)